MCQGLAEVREVMESYGASFDVSLLSAADVRLAQVHATAIKHIAATIEALAAARVAQTGTWRQEGDRSAAHGLARVTGCSVGAAHQILDVGRRLDQQPAIAAEARKGALSLAQTSILSDAAAVNPLAERRLVDTATGASLAELRDECARTKAAGQSDPEASRRQIHSRRRLRSWTDPEGVWHLSAAGNIEEGAQIMSVLAPIRDQLFAEARRQDRREPPDAYAFDALVQLALEAGNPRAGPSDTAGRPQRGAPVKLLIRVDYDTWLRGFPIDGETCELVGYGPLSMAGVRQLIEMGDVFVAAILTRGKALVGVAHLGRRPNAYQTSALQWLYPACAALGCPSQIRLETDHRIDWAKTHYTALDLLDRLCGHHHDLKTRYGWALVDGTGKRPFVPSADPRHPRHQRSTDHTPPRIAAGSGTRPARDNSPRLSALDPPGSPLEADARGP